MILAIILLLAVTGLFIFLFVKKTQALKQTEADLDAVKNKYKGVIDIDTEITRRTNELNSLNQTLLNLNADFVKQKETLNQDFKAKRDIYESLLKEISILETNLEDISFGIYKPQYDYKSSEEYKRKLEEIIGKQKQIIRDERATSYPDGWTVNGSAAEGKKMMKQNSKLMLRAFNGECDAAIAKINWNNFSNMEARIQKAREAINKLSSTHQITITNEYYNLKLQELYLEFELEQKIYQEKEEQRKIREEMREEEKALKEMEKIQRDAEAEAERNKKALDKAKAEVAKAQGTELDKLNQKIKQLQESLDNAIATKERAISQAQLTKSGHVYIISNIGSFGEHVYKIGMTRRLNPQDRIDELGDASVPFDFDVHGIIRSDNAPELENTLHRHLDHKRLNMVNRRAEFFHTTIDEIEEAIKEFKLTVELTKLAEAREYRESVALKAAKEKELLGQTNKTALETKLEKFPTTL